MVIYPAISRTTTPCSMTTIQTKFLNFCIYIALLFFASCLFRKNCSKRVLVEIPIIADYRDTMFVGDTLHYRVTIPDELVDLESNTTFPLPDDFPLGIDLLIDDVDDREDIGRHFSDFDISLTRGDIELSTLSTGLQFGRLMFERANMGRSVQLEIVPKQAGRYGIVLNSVYSDGRVWDERVFTREVELFGGDDCSEELNLIFPLNGGSIRGHAEYVEAVSWATNLNLSEENYRNNGVLFVTIVD